MNVIQLKCSRRQGVCGLFLLFLSICGAILWMIVSWKEPSILQLINFSRGRENYFQESSSSEHEYRTATLGPDVKILKTDHTQTASWNDSCVPYRLPWDKTPSMTLCIYSDRRDPGISRRVRKENVWEPHLVAMAILALKMNDGKDERDRVSLVDIGCNIGTFTVPAASLGFQVLAVEAMGESLQLVDRSLRINGLTHMVTLVHNALSDTHQKLLIRYCQGCGPASAAIGSYKKHNASDERVSEVMSVTLNDVIPLVRTRRVLIKIDIEASEGRALRGGAEFFDHVTVEGVLMEWEHVKHKTGDRDFILTFMAQRGYRAYKSPFEREALDTRKNMSWPSNIYWHK